MNALMQRAVHFYILSTSGTDEFRPIYAQLAESYLSTYESARYAGVNLADLGD